MSTSIPIFPTLFGEASTGKAKMWSISVEPRDSTGVIIQSHGYVGGKLTLNTRVVAEGKNLGKKNATTAIQQAVSEAQSIWNKKRDAGYAPVGTATTAATPVMATVATVTTVVPAVVPAVEFKSPLPMLAQDFNKRGKDIKFPCYAQRKLDGVRCVAIAGQGLFSRNGKATSKHLTHIRAEVDRLASGTVLDGELYSDTLTFQEIVGLVKKATLKAGDAEKMAQIHLCVYDTIRDGTNESRNAWLIETFKQGFTALRLLPSVTCASVDDVKTLHASYVAEGYEGLILRNMAGLYKVGHRSCDLQKYKEFEDAEYVVSGFKEGDGVEKGCVIWECKTAAGQAFAVRPRGTHEQRTEDFKNGTRYIGKKLTVRYQELTTDGIPRFPVGIAFRDYE
jgi:DNA ligase-1